jgi:TP901 family phage tail tape measure protein
MALAGTALVNFQGDYKGLIGGAKGAGTKSGGMAAASFAKKFAMGVAAAGAVGAALYKVGESFDKAFDNIIVGTGATGDALEGLKGDFRAVFGSTAASMDDTSTAIADLNTRLGVTGKPLQDLSKQFLDLSRITKTDVSANIASASRAFGDWGIAVDDQSDALDKMFTVSQQTGIGLDSLANNVVQFGAPLRQFGFSFEESIAIFGKWEKEGVNAQLVMGGLKQGLGRFSKAGKDPERELGRVTEAIKSAGSAGEANQIAIEAFGVRAGPDMAAAVREGRFEIGDLVSALDGAGGSIAQASKDTESFSEKWKIFTNKVLLVLEPIAMRVFDFMGDAMDAMPGIAKQASESLSPLAGAFGAVRDAVEPVFAAIIDFTKKNPTPVFAGLAVVVGGVVVAALWAMATAFFAALSPIILVAGGVALLVGGLIWAYQNVNWFRDAVDKVSSFLTGTLWPALQTAFGFIRDTVVPIVAGLIVWLAERLWPAARNVFGWISGFITGTLVPVALGLWATAQTVFSGISTAITFAWAVIQPIFSALWAFITGPLTTVFNAFLGLSQFVWSLVAAAIQSAWIIVKPIFEAIVWFITGPLTSTFNTFQGLAETVWGAIHGAVSWAWGIISGVFDKIKEAVEGPMTRVWNALADTVSDVFGRIPGFIRSALQTAGGIVAGFMDKVADIAGAIGLTPIKEALESGANSARRWGHDGNAAATASADGRRRMAEGGFISGGVPGKDSVPALLMPGEVVIRKSMVDKYGAANLLALNAGAVPGFAAGGMVGRDELARLARAVGVIGNADTAAAIAMAESGGNPNAFNRNRNGTVDRGLWQINSIHGALSTFDILGNARAMASISGGGSDWTPWVVYNTGAYRQHLDGSGRLGNLPTRDLIGDAVNKAREIAGGLLERVWPEMDVANGLLGLPAGGLNYARSAIIDLIKGKAAEVEGGGDGHGRGGGLAGSTTGLDPDFLGRFNAWNASLGGRYGIRSGFRSRAQQARLYQMYLNGTGNLAARPGNSMHERGLAIDTTPRVSGADQAAARAFRLHFPVGGEPWHVEPFAKGGYVHANSFDSGGSLRPGWNVVRNDTGANEPLKPSSGGRDAPVIGEAHFHDGVDIDLVLQKLAPRVKAGAV